MSVRASTARAGFQYGRRLGENGSIGEQVARLRSGQGITGDAKAILGFFALLVIGVFVLGKIDSNLDFAGLDSNYSASANQTSSGFLDYIELAVVLPVVIIGGLMLGVIARFL